MIILYLSTVSDYPIFIMLLSFVQSTDYLVFVCTACHTHTEGEAARTTRTQIMHTHAEVHVPYICIFICFWQLLACSAVHMVNTLFNNDMQLEFFHVTFFEIPSCAIYYTAVCVLKQAHCCRLCSVITVCKLYDKSFIF